MYDTASCLASRSILGTITRPAPVINQKKQSVNDGHVDAAIFELPSQPVHQVVADVGEDERQEDHGKEMAQEKDHADQRSPDRPFLDLKPASFLSDFAHGSRLSHQMVTTRTRTRFAVRKRSCSVMQIRKRAPDSRRAFLQTRDWRTLLDSSQSLRLNRWSCRPRTLCMCTSRRPSGLCVGMCTVIGGSDDFRTTPEDIDAGGCRAAPDEIGVFHAFHLVAGGAESDSARRARADGDACWCSSLRHHRRSP
jgi:hypothetical protein